MAIISIEGFDEYSSQSDEFEFIFCVSKETRGRFNHENIYCPSIKGGWYISAACSSQLIKAEIIALTKWCKDSLSGYWTIGSLYLYISKEEDFIQFKLTWM
jgi:hypothetical protein